MTEQRVGPPERTRPFTWVVLCVFVLIVLLFVVGFLSPSPTPAVIHTAAPSSDTDKVWNYGSKKSADGVMTLRATYWCGVTFDDAGMIGVAVYHKDTMALAGLLGRGKAFQVEQGTRIVTGGSDMGISLGFIQSGFQAGRKCYISTNALE
jgi:hypothetical protein